MKTAIDAHNASLNARVIRGAYLAQSIGAIAKTAIGALSAKAVYLGNAFSA